MRQKHASIIIFISVLFALASFSDDIHAQCKTFVKNNCVPNLSPYIHDGSYQAVIMSEGEEAEIYKTVFAGQQYRLYICIEDNLPVVEFVVSDIHRNILFDNRDKGNIKYWDFKADASQQVKVTIRLPKSKAQNEGEQELNFGCVGILFGLLDKQ
jgi:hypothetical protein